MGARLDKKLGRRVAILRKRTSMSQSSLADAVGTATQVISRLERGVAIPSLGRLGEIADALGVEMRALFTFEEASHGATEAAIERVVGILRRQPVKRIDLIRRIAVDVIKSSG
jgi:transcriptional regulator with XRE-family HTH domain